jgi:hypothetical protein
MAEEASTGNWKQNSEFLWWKLVLLRTSDVQHTHMQSHVKKKEGVLVHGYD